MFRGILTNTMKVMTQDAVTCLIGREDRKVLMGGRTKILTKKGTIQMGHEKAGRTG